MKITFELLEDLNDCEDVLSWFEENINEPIEHDDLINKLIEYNIQWAVWLIVRLLTRKNKIRLAIFAARKVLPIFEVEYPNDNRPRKAIEDTEKYLNNEISIDELRVSANAANAARIAAYEAYATADSAYAAPYAAANVARAASHAAKAAKAANKAAKAANKADASADTAARAAADAVDKKTSLIDTINYGIELIKNNEE